MALEDYNSLLIEHLEQLLAAAESADEEAAMVSLGKLEEEGFDEALLAPALAAWEEGQFDVLVEWCGARLSEMKGDLNPFDDFDFDIDDAFLDVEDTGFREPSESSADEDLLGDLGGLDSNPAFEVVDDVSLKEDSEDAEDDEPEEPHGRPHVLSGRFNLVSKEAVAADKEERLSFAESLDRAAKEATDGEKDVDRQTRPNVTPDLREIRKAAQEAVESAPPPVDRLPASEVSGELAINALELSDSEEPDGSPFRETAESAVDPPTREVQVPDSESSFELEASPGFDFGFDDDEEDDVAADDADGDFDFDLGLSNPEERSTASDAGQTKPGPSEEKTSERDRHLTPMAQTPAVSRDPEDMFFELAEALAADSSVGEVQYRGEPLRSVHSATTNPFGNDMPTGTAHAPLSAAIGGNAAESVVHTNMNAILLEAHRLRSSGELGAALDIARKVLSRDPSDDAEALVFELEAELEKEHLAKVGSLEQTPTLGISMGEIATLSLDHRAGYVISQVDGMMTFEDLLELSGMGRLETLAVFADLLDQSVIVT